MIIFITASVFTILALIGLILNLMQFDYNEYGSIEGEKVDVLYGLRSYIYRCEEKSRGITDSSVCYKLFLNFTGTITQEELANILDESVFKSEELVVEDIQGPTEVIIKSENRKIFVETR